MLCVIESSPAELPRKLIEGGPLRCVLALLPRLTDEQLSLLKTDVIGHVQRHLKGSAPRAVCPGDPAELGPMKWTAELETEAALQERGPVPGARAARPDDDEPADADATPLEPVTVFHQAPQPG